MTNRKCHYSFCALRNKTDLDARSRYFTIRFVSTKRKSKCTDLRGMCCKNSIFFFTGQTTSTDTSLMRVWGKNGTVCLQCIVVSFSGSSRDPHLFVFNECTLYSKPTANSPRAAAVPSTVTTVPRLVLAPKYKYTRRGQQRTTVKVQESILMIVSPYRNGGCAALRCHWLVPRMYHHRLHAHGGRLHLLWGRFVCSYNGRETHFAIASVIICIRTYEAG